MSKGSGNRSYNTHRDYQLIRGSFLAGELTEEDIAALEEIGFPFEQKTYQRYTVEERIEEMERDFAAHGRTTNESNHHRQRLRVAMERGKVSDEQIARLERIGFDPTKTRWSPLTSEQEQAICQDALSCNDTLKEVAARHGVSRPTVKNVLTRNGIDRASTVSKKVRHIETGKVYESASAAAQDVFPENPRARDSVYECCNGARLSAYGQHFEYADPALRPAPKKNDDNTGQYKRAPVACVETDEHYPTISAASKGSSISVGRLQRCIETGKPDKNGRHWIREERNDNDIRSTKEVRCIETNRDYPSVKDAAVALSKELGRQCSPKAIQQSIKRQNRAYGFHWEYTGNLIPIARVAGKAVRHVETGQCFESVRHCAKSLFPGSESARYCIGQCCHGAKHSYRGQHFEWVDNPDPSREARKHEPRTHHNSVAVRCVETGQVFLSEADAGRAVGVSGGAVHNALKSGRRSGGFHWVYDASPPHSH